jgi:flavin reductase (DIM6/NTAB) family NADH-FMN oxidoreductase RutF
MPVEAAQFREALAQCPASVTVVTSADARLNPVGATVSAFSSLSLDPPLILVCLTRESRTTKAIRARQAFAVHVLHAAQASLARRFAADMADKFAGLAYGFNAAGVPCLGEAELRLECTLHAEIEGGDHVIFVGLVDAAEQVHDFAPLVYVRRTFFSLGAQAMEGQ